ncbi:DUF6777 domain-containing protein [Actinomadura luteofluorescens]|uniref:DUF6777 domain-containing protein n=1 Tax=Actinomadura luteofluorescens TaxID=46163 RepID=A0A7Y9JJI4_9ACTN|nr:FecR/PupR family sigma factor regulator [Actinomadura luteofluorescens]NYD51205.1 hypothetical protein [Actinomadura luteofluorescens]
MLQIRSTIARSGIGAVPLAGAVAAIVAAGALTGCGDAGATITRLTVGSPGPDPYTLASGTDKAGVKARPQAGGTKEGDSPGLYGGTRQASTCDREKLAAFLRTHPEKARAWARVQGIPVDDIPRYVSRQTPVLLRTDTLVTNHGYRDGRPTSDPAVLQAGMGVLVNGYGVPTVKCNCGNPLTPPDKKISTRNASYGGRSWPGFEKGNVTRIRPRDSQKGTIVTFVLVNPEATMGFERPRATEGAADGPPTALPPTETEVVASDSPAPSGSGLETPGTESPGPETPGAETPGPETPGGQTPDTETPGPQTPGPALSSPSPGVTTQDPGTDAGGKQTPGDGGHGPVSLPPSKEPASGVS